MAGKSSGDVLDYALVLVLLVHFLYSIVKLNSFKNNNQWVRYPLISFSPLSKVKRFWLVISLNGNLCKSVLFQFSVLELKQFQYQHFFIPVAVLELELKLEK